MFLYCEQLKDAIDCLCHYLGLSLAPTDAEYDFLVFGSFLEQKGL